MNTLLAWSPSYRLTGRKTPPVRETPRTPQTLEDSTRILGPHHPDTLTSRNNLAYAYRDAGRLDEAIPLYEQNLEDSTRILGTNHPNTLISRNNLAGAYRDAGRLDEAIALHGQILEDRTRILGPHHPNTLTSRNNLAYAYRAAGRLEEAITLHEQWTAGGFSDSACFVLQAAFFRSRKSLSASSGVRYPRAE